MHAQMTGQGRLWAPWIVAALVAAVLAFFSYQYGISQGAGGAGPVVRVAHFGFPWGLLFFLWFVPALFRRIFWGPWYWYRRPWRGGWRYTAGYGPHDPYDPYPPPPPNDPDYDARERQWQEWHRRAHERDAARPTS